jgi:CRP/FNR family transcriptional regulator
MSEIEQLAEQLHGVSYFKTLSGREVIDIVTAGEVKQVKAGTYLFVENDPCAGMYVLVQGQVNLLKTGPDGQETILNTVDPVTMFNEVPVLDGGPNPVSAYITHNALLWRINCDRFQQLLLRHPQVGVGMLSVLAKRNRLMLGHYVDLSFRTIPARISKYLLEISNDGNDAITRSQHPIREMAARVVAAPEVISRTLKFLKDNRIIDCSRSFIKIIDLEGLQKMAKLEV